MATNAEPGHGREGEIKGRSQSLNPQNRRWTKRDMTGKFMDQKANFAPFKAVKKIIHRKNP